MTTALAVVALLIVSFGAPITARGALYPAYGAWLEGEITNPSGETSYLGGYGTQTLTDDAFGTGTAQSYVVPSTGQTGLYTQAESPGPAGTYARALSRYYDVFTFYPYTILPTRINVSIGMSYQFISPTGGIFEGFSKAGEAGFKILFNADGALTKEYRLSHAEDHTGTWDTPPGSMGLYGADLGYWLWRYCGRSDQTFSFGDQISMVFEFYTWAQNGATVNALYTGDFKFTLPDEVREAGGGLIVTSVSGLYQEDGVVPTSTTTTTSPTTSTSTTPTTTTTSSSTTTTTTTLPEGLIPGGGPTKSDCYAELAVIGIENPSDRVKNNKIVSCTDGEPCDTGPCGDHTCNVRIRLCINQQDSNLPGCTPPGGLDSVKVKSQGKVKLNVPAPPLLQGSTCGGSLDGTIPVKINKKGRVVGVGKAKIKIDAKAPKGTKPRADEDTITIQCVPRTMACPQ